MEVEQKITNFINKQLERFASFQDEEHLTNPRKGSFSTSQGSSPRGFSNQHPPQKSSSTYQSGRQADESHELFRHVSQDNSASSVDEYHGKTQYRGDMLNNFVSSNKVLDISKKEYRLSVSGPGGLNEGQGSPRRQEAEGFRSTVSWVHNYAQKKLIDSSKRLESMEFQRPASGVNNYSESEWIDSPRRRESMGIMQTNKAAEFSRAHQNNDQRKWSGSPQSREEIEFRIYSPGVRNFFQKEYIGSPKMEEAERKMMQNREANKAAGFSRAHKYQKAEWNGSPRKPEVITEDTKKYYDQRGFFIELSQGLDGEVMPIVQTEEGRAGEFSRNVGYERYGSRNEYHQSQGSYKEKIYNHQSQPEFPENGHQLKGPYMDSIEAAKLFGGVLIFDYSKY